MTERAEMTFMHARIARIATQKWGVSICEVGRLFDQYKAFQHIRDCYDLYHVEGDEAVWEDMQPYFHNKGYSCPVADNSRSLEVSNANESIGLSVEKENTAIDMIVSMVAEELADKMNTSTEEALPGFLQSRICATLYDRESKLWCDGPSHVVELYLSEINNQELLF